MGKIGRNAPCPCGSGKKYKKCCLQLATDVEREQSHSSPLPLPKRSDILNQVFMHISIAAPKELHQSLRAMCLQNLIGSALANYLEVANDFNPYEDQLTGLFYPVRRLKLDFFQGNIRSHLKKTMTPSVFEITKAITKSRLTILKIDLTEQDHCRSKSIEKALKLINDPYLADICQVNCDEGEFPLYYLDSCTDSTDKKKIHIPCCWLPRNSPLKGQYTLAYVMEIANICIAIPNIDEFLFDEDLLDLAFNEGQSQKQIASWVGIAEQNLTWSMLLSSSYYIWEYHLNKAKDELRMEGLRCSQLRLAQIWAENLVQEAGEQDGAFDKILNKLIGPEKEKYQDIFSSIWDKGRLKAWGQGDRSIPHGQQLVKALLQELSEEEELLYAARTRKKRGARKSDYQHFHRYKRSNFNPLDIKEIQLTATSQTLKSCMLGIMHNYGFSLTVPAIQWSHDSVDLELNVVQDLVILPVSFLAYEWSMLEELAKWVLATLLAEQYQKNNSLSKSKAFEMAAKRLCLSKEFADEGDKLKTMPKHWKFDQAGLDDRQKSVMRKVDKLFSLASSSNKSEADLAMQRAQELLNNYNLDKSKLESSSKSSLVKLTLYLERQSASRLINEICGILSSFYFVRIIYGKAWNYEKESFETVVNVLGERHNVLMAEHVFDFLVYKADNLWKKAKKDGLTNKQKLSFQVGLIWGFRASLEKIEEGRRKAKTTEQNLNALIALNEEQLNDYVDSLYPSLRDISRRRLSVDKEGYQAGTDQGSKLRIDRPIANREDSKGGTPLLGP